MSYICTRAIYRAHDLWQTEPRIDKNDRVTFRPTEVKSHPFFADVDWQTIYLRRLPPPLIPPRGEVNAADAFDIGNFDDDEVKGVKVRRMFSLLFNERHKVSLLFFCIIFALYVALNAAFGELQRTRRNTP